MQEDVSIVGNTIYGTLKHVTDYEGFDEDPELQNGNFLALKVDAPEGSTTYVELVGGHSGPVELDSDMNIVLRIESTSEQHVRVTVVTGDERYSKDYDLTGLTLNYD